MRMQGLMTKDELAAGVCRQFVFSNILQIMLPVFFLIFTAHAYPGEYISYVKPAKYKIMHTVTVTNYDVNTLATLEMALPIPTKWPETSIRDVRYAKTGCFELSNLEGPGQLLRSFYTSDLPMNGQNKSIKLSYLATVCEIRTNKARLEKREYPSYTINDEYKYYTRHELMVECNEPLIINVADEIKQKTKNPYQIAKLAYEYVVDNVEYTSPSPSWTAQECIKTKKGACGQQAALFVAICRAGGVPARPVAGAWCAGDDQWHCWAEFLLPEVGWIPADPSVGARGPKEKEYYFGNLDNDHLALMKCFNSRYDCTQGAKEVGFTQVGYWLWFCSGPSKGSKIMCEYKLHGEVVKNK